MRILILLFAFALTTSAERFVDAGDGVRLWITERGKGSPVIVIHGGPGMDHATLAADLAPLERHHRVIYYDQRGGGRSTLPADTALLTIDHHVRDLEALRRHLGLEKVTLLAHSFGPAIAARYAIAHPERVERMIFLGPIPPRKGNFFEEYGKRLRARLTEEQSNRAEALSFDTDGDVKAVCREYWSIMTPPRVAKSISPNVVKADLCAASAEAIRYGMTKTNSVTFSSLGDWNWSGELAKVNAPTLIIHGEEDAIPMEMVEVWSALPNAHLVRLKETAHFPHAERPDVVFKAIEEFLRGARSREATSVE